MEKKSLGRIISSVCRFYVRGKIRGQKPPVDEWRWMIDLGSVRVAGALVGQPDVELTVKDSHLHEEDGTRNFTVMIEAHNRGALEVNMDPRLFQMVLSHTADPLGETRPQNTYPHAFRFLLRPGAFQLPSSYSLIPPGATRYYTLHFWGRNLPSGEGWKEHYLSLEYYDPASSIMLSNLLNPAER